ncbi:MAG: branched-chain amino acid aminotransferase [Oscillospiraceae bacterium]|jgi:branched-chain amino acid aminotransferase|nr:branched-chain amino acid aminotransferase [Oscillospiraceae bacterium]
MSNITIHKTTAPKAKPDQSKLGFGKIFSDHMFLMDYTAGKGWHDARIVPYGPISLDPSAMVFHYAQEIFEGLKAYRRADGGIQLFRPWANIQRMKNSCERLCIPVLDDDLYLEALTELVKLDADWIPTEPDTSLYIRPFIIATEPHVGVHASSSYIFCIITSPVGAYYAEGLNPVKIYVESRDVRAVKGGMGYAKTGGNYAASLRAGEIAGQKGYSQVLWLDGAERKYIEEVGSMNVFFKIDGEVVTPPLAGSILPGVTRDSCIKILESWGYTVSQRPLSAEELFNAAAAGKLEEAWGSGTAAVISPIGQIAWGDKQETVCGGKIGEVTQKLYDYLTGIQWGRIEDPFGWIYKIS